MKLARKELRLTAKLILGDNGVKVVGLGGQVNLGRVAIELNINSCLIGVFKGHHVIG
jgi:hypothetical protein